MGVLMKMPSLVRTLVFGFALSFASIASAANLAFTSPTFNAVNGNALPVFTQGQKITISWTTTYANTSLTVYQENDSGGYDAFDLLAGSYPQSQTSFVWTVASVRTDGTLGGSFHFFLQNSANPDCSGCYANSPLFNVKASSSATSLATSSATRSSPTSTSSPTSAFSPTTSLPASSSPSAVQTSSPVAMTTSATSGGSQSATAAAAGTTSGPSSKTPSLGLGIPLGVGLGAGIPVIAAIVAIICMFVIQRRKKQRQQRERRDEEVMQKHSRDTSGTSSWSRDAQMTQEKRDSRESGALGPWGHPRNSYGHPHWSNQFRPSMAATTEEPEDDDSERRRSYLQPFEFEMPRSRDQEPDELSHVRNSIAEAPSEGSNYSRSERSFGENGGMAAVPHSVHSPHPDDEWPLPVSR